MKNKPLWITVILLTIVTIAFYQKEVNPVVENNKKINRYNTSVLSINLETSVGSGVYEEATDNKWPTSGYTFNTELSRCEKGSEITWDEETKKVTVSSNKSDKCYVYFDKISSFADYIIGLYTTQGSNGLYLHNSSLANSAADASYRYAGGEYIVSNDYWETYNNISDIIKIKNVAGYIKYYLINNENITYDYSKDVLARAITEGYVINNDINNYVCFGSDAKNCPYDNLYRIIGVFENSVKLIKADLANDDLLGTDGDFYKSYNNNEELNNDYFNYSNVESIPYKGLNKKHSRYYWNRINYNQTFNETQRYHIWSYSELNKTNLNINFINNLGTQWSDLIKESIWYTSGFNASYDNVDAKLTFDYELGNKKNDNYPFIPYNAKIGLIYVSEYYYSAIPYYWNRDIDLNINDQYILSIFENWMYIGIDEWSISPLYENNNYAWYIGNNGNASYSRVYNSYNASNIYADSKLFVRPTFYLNENVIYAGGTGTETDPYRIA